MKVVVSGTHASGKSVLVAALVEALDDVEVLPDPYEVLGEDLGDEPDAGGFFEQLVLAADRLSAPAPHHVVLAERGPLDLLAYLEALDVLGRPGRDGGLAERGRSIAVATASSIDLLLLLDPDDVVEPDDEDPPLRRAVAGALLDLADDPDLVGDALVVELAGDPQSRLRQALAALAIVQRGS